MVASTATKGLMAQIADLHEEAASFDEEARDLHGKLVAAMQRRKAALDQISELSKQASSEAFDITSLPEASVAPTNGVVPKRRGPAASNTTPVATVTPARRGRKPNAVAAKKSSGNGAAKKAAKATGGRNYENEMTLTDTIWDVLDRDNGDYKKIFPDFNLENEGLKVSEIKAIIEQEGKYKSSSADIGPMIQQQLSILRHEGKIARSQKEDRRNFIVDGADLYGPPLNANGTPMEEKPDGTFLTSAKKVFMRWKPGKGPDKPYKLRRKGQKEE